MKRGRPPHPDTLTPREHEVLQLISEGLTNEQIAVRLGISFGGAKYHVAEILSKLGANSREEAVPYLTEPRRTRFGVFAPLMFWKRDGAARSPAGAKAVVTGGAALLAVLGLLAFFPVLRGSGGGDSTRDLLAGISADFGFDAQGNLIQRPARPLASYYFEAKVGQTISPYADLMARVPRSALPQGTVPTHMRSWSSGEHTRTDMLREDSVVRRTVSDGATDQFYDSQTNTYTKHERQVDGSIELGPLSPQAIAGLFGAQNWKHAGRDVVAGRITQVVELVTDSEVKRVWLDPEYGFVLKHEVVGGIAPRLYEVTRVDYNRAVSAQELRFEVPSAALEVGTVTGPIDMAFSLGPFGGPTSDAPEGMLSLGYVPEGHNARGSSASHRPTDATKSMTLSYVVSYGPGHDGPTSLMVAQQYRAGGMTQDMQVGQAVSVRDGLGYRQSAAGEERLVFEAGDVIVTLTSAALPFEELLKIADGMRLA